MNPNKARKLLHKVDKALQSDKPMTNVSAVLRMNIDWFDTVQDWQDAVAVRIADLKKVAQHQHTTSTTEKKPAA